jgi:phage gp36-like protein
MYCTQADILERITAELLAQLTDDVDGDTIDSDVVSRAIADADSVIDGYVGKRYTLPLSTVPPVLLKASTEISIYNLYSRRMGAPDEWRTRYEDNRSWLKELAAGKVTLGVESTESTPKGAPVEMSSNERQFTRDKLKGF